MNRQAIIDLSGLGFRWKNNSDLITFPDLKVYHSDHIFIQGMSGSGKTTLLNLLAGISLPDHGKIEVLNKDLATLSQFQRDRFRADHLGIIFQQFNLIPYLSVVENIELSTWFSPLKKSRLKDKSLHRSIKDMLEQLNLAAFIDSPVSQLSVGQQQRVAIARALFGNPEIILADEPTSALDNDNQNQFMKLLFEHVDKNRSTLVFVSHDDRLKKYFSHTVKIGVKV